MRKTIASVWITLDGVFDAEPKYFEQWFMPYHSDARADYIQKSILGCGALLMGRTTYSALAPYWSAMQNNEMGVADKMNKATKYVVSTLLRTLRFITLMLATLGLTIGLSACDVLSTETPGALVPPTADEDPALPQLRVRVAGHERMLHLQAFGEPNDPVLLVLPGGPGADSRLLLPLQALSDRYHVVMWDPRGAGLSERVPEDELTLNSFNEEIAAVQAAVAPGRPVTLVGHSFGGLLALRYAATFPDAVAQLVLLEPGPITPRGRRYYRGGEVNFSAGEDFFWQNELLTSSDHAAADYKAVALLPEASRSFTCSGDPPPEYPMWRFGAFHHHVLTHTAHAPDGDFNWADGIENLNAELLIVAGTCGAASADFQRTYNLGALPRANLAVISGAGHLTLFLNHADETLQALRSYLAAYR